MSELNIIEKGVRSGLRFKSEKGLLTTEDLWTIPLEVEVRNSRNNPSMYKLAGELNKEIKEKNDDLSFITKKRKSKNDMELDLKFEIVKYIIETRHIETEVKEKAEALRTKKGNLRTLIDKKKLEKEAGKSIDELEALYNSMED
jgi:hypothetical protein